MNRQEAEYMKMARDPKFMAERYKQRLAQNERELKKRSPSLSPEERVKYQGMLRKQNEKRLHYERKAQEEG